jgi:thiamine biosynthesis lipoprotein
MPVDAAFAAVARVQRCMSRFDPASDIGRFAALPVHEAIEVDAWTLDVLEAARELHQASHGAFDIALGSVADGWSLTHGRLAKHDAQARLDLGGIAKGYAVDRAIEAMQAAGATAGWVNAGGDLRVFGALELPVWLRDEHEGGVHALGTVSNGAVATSRLGHAHVSVTAPCCLWADALTKLAVRDDHAAFAPLLQAHGARAWRH